MKIISLIIALVVPSIAAACPPASSFSASLYSSTMYAPVQYAPVQYAPVQYAMPSVFLQQPPSFTIINNNNNNGGSSLSSMGRRFSFNSVGVGGRAVIQQSGRRFSNTVIVP